MSTKERIVAAAWKLFDEAGEDGPSIRALADAVAVTPMAIYRHFEGKDAILEALADGAFDAWEARARAVRAADPMTWLRKIGMEALEFALSEPRKFEAAFLVRTRRTRVYPADFAAGKSPVISMMMERLDAAMASGVLQKAPAVELAMSLWAHTHGLLVLYRTGRFSMEERAFRTLYRRSVDRLLRGMEAS